MPNYGIGTEIGSKTTTTAGTGWYEYTTTPNYACEPIVSIPSVWIEPTPLYQNKKRDDDMRYLYYVILVNPKTDEFFTTKVVAKSETSALMEAYSESNFSNVGKISEGIIAIGVPFDDLKYNCKQLMEWKEEKSLEKALETIKKAVE